MALLRRNLTSSAVLLGFLVLAAGSTPELAAELEDLADEVDAAGSGGGDEFGAAGGTEGGDVGIVSGGSGEEPRRGVIPSEGFTLAALKGRQVWVVNSPDRTPCDKLAALGMIVECDPSWDHTGSPEIVIWCTEIPHVAAPALLEHLGVPQFDVRTHQVTPQFADDNECGDLYEITIRYVD